MARPLTIGQVAKTTSVAAKTIRYYERVGILPPQAVPHRAIDSTISQTWALWSWARLPTP